MEFQCRYIHNWAYSKALSGHMRRRKRLPWVILLVFCGLMLAFCLWVGTLPVLLPVYFACMVAFCFYRAFLWRRLSTRAQWERVCAVAKTDRIETVFTLDGKEVRFTQQGTPAGSFLWTACARIAVEEDWIVLTLKGKKRPTGASFFLPKAGFSDGSGQAFLDWAAREHPEFFLKKGGQPHV